MRTKIVFLVGLAIGYVLGARAGHERYEQIKSRSQQLWNSQPVQDKVSSAGGAVKAKAPVVQQRVGDAAKHAAESAKSKIGDMRSHPTTPNGASSQPTHM